MSEAPERCEQCPIDSHDVYGVRSCGESIGETHDWRPGPGCPFVRLDLCATGVAGMLDMLDAKDAEIETLKLCAYDGECRLNEANAEIAENADDYQTAIVGMQDALDEKDAENERLRAFVDEIADSPCTAPTAGYAEGRGEVSCYLECATCRARVYNVEYPRQALEGES